MGRDHIPSFRPVCIYSFPEVFVKGIQALPTISVVRAAQMSCTRLLDEEDINGWRGTLAARPMEIAIASWPREHHDDISVRYPLESLTAALIFPATGRAELWRVQI